MKCKARRTDGEPCQQWAAAGQEVCRYHGGGSPQAKAAAARRVDEEAARRQAARLGLSRDVAPGEALLEEVRRCAGLVDFFEQRVVELGGESEYADIARDPLVWSEAESEERDEAQNPGTKTTTAAQPSVWYVLYAAERDRLVKASTAALKAGVEERRVRLAEQEGQLVGLVLRRILDGLLDAMLAAGMAESLRAVWAQAVTEIAPRELRRLSTGEQR